MTKQELRQLIQDMSIDEKIHQLMQLPGSYYERDATITGNIENSKFTKSEIEEAGSVLGVFGAEKIRKIQKEYMEKQPHHIPLLFMLDVIHGLRTIFPMPLAQGAAFNPDMTEHCAAAAARESAVSGVHVTFAPMADLVRDARWGRVMESTGEDPYLNSLLTAAMVRGFQGKSVAEWGKVAACVKHFAAYGAPDGGREYNNVELSEHTLREFYFPAYEAGVKEGARLVMTSFNTLNGIPSSGNEWLMRSILREEMGFDGVLISDWAAIDEMIAHGFCEDKKEAGFKAIKTGVDIDMVTDVYSSSLSELLNHGDVEESLVDEAVLRVLQLKNELGLFENPYKDADGTEEKNIILCEEHRKLSREAARETFVLLKNEEVKGKTLLPLDRKKKIAFIGPYVHSQELHSSWSIAGRCEDTISIHQAVKNMMSDMDVVFERGCPGSDYKEEQLKEAAEAANTADIVVLCIGEHRLLSGEAASRADIGIPEIQMELFRRVCKVNKNVITVIFSGRPLDLRKISEQAKAVLEVWMPGTEGGNAILEVLTGEYNPSGKLPMSFPYSVGQVPIYYNHYATGRPRKGKEDETFYCSRYRDIPNEPLYSFGYGLSYTSFSISSIRLDRIVLGRDRKHLFASAFVKNTGNVIGTEIVQLYIRDEVASVVRPVKELKSFRRLALAPDEEEKVAFEITEEMLRFHNADGELISERGRFTVWIGNSSETENSAEFYLE